MTIFYKIIWYCQVYWFLGLLVFYKFESGKDFLPSRGRVSVNYSEKAKYPSTIKLIIGIIVNIPNQLALLRAFAISIHKIIPTTMFTNGIK